MQHAKPPDSHSERKTDHLLLAKNAQTSASMLDRRFLYEPMLGRHIGQADLFRDNWPGHQFLSKKLLSPLWISSMTGGTSGAGPINQMLAKVAKQYKLAMGLGSCRQLLESDQHFADFNLRPILGDDCLFFANLGIAQIEAALLNQKMFNRILELIHKLEADGLIIHINPLQEFYQKEGDRFNHMPITTLTTFLGRVNFPVIVKEVGQGMGPESLLQLMQLPIAAIDFAAFGGTNFSVLENNRKGNTENCDMAYVGHDAQEMMAWTTQNAKKLGDKLKVKNIIISGGIRKHLDALFLTASLEKVGFNTVYGMAGPLLEQANLGQEALDEFVLQHILAYENGKQFLRVRN